MRQTQAAQSHSYGSPMGAMEAKGSLRVCESMHIVTHWLHFCLRRGQRSQGEGPGLRGGNGCW